MLKRPEIGSREHILLWLAAKPAKEKYTWDFPDNCACGQYCSEFYENHNGQWLDHRVAGFGAKMKVLYELNSIAGDVATRPRGRQLSVGTFGDLYKAAYQTWT